MHRYQPLWSDDPDHPLPNPSDFTYRSARDVAAFAALDPLTTWYTYPHLWHLDQEGRWCCGSKGFSLDTLIGLAQRPDELLDCRMTDVGQACPDFWVILEPRHAWRSGPIEPTEADVLAFGSLRRWFAANGVCLLDVMVFTADYRWWSLHELTSGTTTWRFECPEP